MNRLLRHALYPSLAALLFSGQATAGQSADEPPWAVGSVYSEDGETLLYREHLYADDPDLANPTRVLYRTPDGELFAEKLLDYSQSLSAPAVDFRDHRNQARIRTSSHGERNSQPERIQLAFRPDDSERLRETELRYNDSLIVDAGFDAYIRQNWDELTENARLLANFLVPSRLDTVRVALTETDRSNCRTEQENIYCFEVRPAGFLRVVSWFVDPIRVAYEQESRRLVLYDGMGNIPDEAGDNRNVLIRYEYADRPEA